MKVTFICNMFYPVQQAHFSFAVGALSASLKQAGHQTSLLQFTTQVSERTLLSALRRESPDLVGFTAITHTIRYAKTMASWIKKRMPYMPVICGGVHATLDPRDTLREDGFDMVCVGEGDRAIVDLCARLESGEDVAGIPNIWSKANGHVHPQRPRPLIADLDQLPFVDRQIFDIEALVDTSVKAIRVMASRGCPYSCTYCSNHRVRSIYPDNKRYVRYRSVANVLCEIEQLLRDYPFIEFINFQDDNLPLHKAWFRQFVEAYSSRIGLPFKCNCHPTLMSEEVAGMLRRAGCQEVHFGVESGNEWMRKEVLNRSVSQRQMKDAFDRCRNVGITTLAYNMLGLPLESPRTILDTCKLNAQIRPDGASWHMFTPYPGTKLHELSRKRGFLTGRHFDTFMEGTTLCQPTLSESQVTFVLHFAWWIVFAYRLLMHLPRPVQNLGDRAMECLLASRMIPHGWLAYMKRRIAGRRRCRPVPGGAISLQRSRARRLLSYVF